MATSNDTARFSDLKARLAALGAEMLEDDSDDESRYYVLDRNANKLVSIGQPISEIYTWVESTEAENAARDRGDDAETVADIGRDTREVLGSRTDRSEYIRHSAEGVVDAYRKLCAARETTEKGDFPLAEFSGLVYAIRDLEHWLKPAETGPTLVSPTARSITRLTDKANDRLRATRAIMTALAADPEVEAHVSDLATHTAKLVEETHALVGEMHELAVKQ
jgi:hypothetical protein